MPGITHQIHPAPEPHLRTRQESDHPLFGTCQQSRAPWLRRLGRSSFWAGGAVHVRENRSVHRLQSTTCFEPEVVYLNDSLAGPKMVLNGGPLTIKATPLRGRLDAEP